MRVNRAAVAAVAGVAALVIGGGSALAGGSDGDKGGRCEAQLAKIAERRGVSVDQLQADLKARLLARVDAALTAGRISGDQAARLRERIADATLCARTKRHVHHAIRGLFAAAAEYLGLSRSELREQLPGTSLAALAVKQGKTVEGLKAALLAPAKSRLAKAVADGVITQPRADALLARLGTLVDRLVAKTFPAK